MPVLYNREEHFAVIAKLGIFAANVIGIKLSCFFKRSDTQIIEEPFALFFCQFKALGPEDFIDLIRRTEYAAHDHSPFEIAFIVPASHLCHYASAACGLSCNGDIIGITAEVRNVAADPFQAGLLIEAAEIAGRIRLLFCKLRMAEKAQRSQAVIHSHDDDISPCETFTVKFHFGCIATLKPAAEKPYKHGFALGCGLRVRPYIKIKAVLTHGNIGIDMPFAAVNIVSIAGWILN